MVSNWNIADLRGEDSQSQCQAAHAVLKALDKAGKMQPIDQKWLDMLEEKVKSFEE